MDKHNHDEPDPEGHFFEARHTNDTPSRPRDRQGKPIPSSLRGMDDLPSLAKQPAMPEPPRVGPKRPHTVPLMHEDHYEGNAKLHFGNSPVEMDHSIPSPRMVGKRPHNDAHCYSTFKPPFEVTKVELSSGAAQKRGAASERGAAAPKPAPNKGNKCTSLSAEKSPRCSTC